MHLHTDRTLTDTPARAKSPDTHDTRYAEMATTLH